MASVKKKKAEGGGDRKGEDLAGTNQKVALRKARGACSGPTLSSLKKEVAERRWKSTPRAMKGYYWKTACTFYRLPRRLQDYEEPRTSNFAQR